MAASKDTFKVAPLRHYGRLRPRASARKGALIHGILILIREGRHHLLLGGQAGSRSRRRSRSRESAFCSAKATPRPNLPRCCVDYRIDQRRCVFQSGPQASCFTSEQGSQSRGWQAPGGNECITPEQGGQSGGSQAGRGRLTPEQKSQSRQTQAPGARAGTENSFTERPDECGQFDTKAATNAPVSHTKGGNSPGPTAQV